MQDENTGLQPGSVQVPPLAELRWEQVKAYGKWTAERTVTTDE